MLGESLRGQSPRGHLHVAHAEAVSLGRANLLLATNAWRVARDLPPLPDEAAQSTSPFSSGVELPATVTPESFKSLVIRPQRAGRRDADREAAAIALGLAETATIITRYHGLFGWIYNADNMSEMLEVHDPVERWRHHDAVRSTASALTQAAFDWAMAQPVRHADEVVHFTGGGNGSGKSTFVVGNQRGVWLDSTLSDYDSSVRNITTALQSGRSVAITFVYRAPVDAYLHGVVPRTLDPQNGRPVTIETHARTHAKAPATFVAIAREFGGDHLLSAQVIENRSGAMAQVRDLDWLHARSEIQPNVDALRLQLLECLEREVPHSQRERFTASPL